MANRARLGGSPLGLIGLKSSPDINGNSTFNGGNSRNVFVADYNISRAGSLFTGKRILRAWPGIKVVDGVYDTKGINDVDYPVLSQGTASSPGEDKYKQASMFGPKALHNNTVYDTSVLNIIEQLASTKASLKPADFAYLKNIGVYPNNRLMIARRFAAPSDDNIMVPKSKGELNSLATLISWVPEGIDFLDLSFGEEWVDAEADFKGILSSIGDDLGLGNLGGIAGGAGSVVPLPGFTEIFQRQFLSSLKLFDDNAGASIPAGNPNLIKSAKRRKTIGYSEAGAGLKAGISIKMTCEYELKYISGIDPSIVWMDLLGMILRFGTSSSETYGLSKGVAAKLIGWANNPDTLIRDVVAAIKGAIAGVVIKVTASIEKIYKAVVDGASALNKPPETDPPATASTPGEESIAAGGLVRTAGLALIGKVGDLLKDVSTGMIMKYRVKIIGIVNALSGLPSTPWHITIGNPMRPMFCSGDMLTDSVQVKLGPQLGFNDLPSSITVEFTLANARPLGLQEIMSKFNSGYLRTIDVQKSFYETKTLPGSNNSKTEPLGFLPLEVNNKLIYTEGTSSVVGTTPSNTGANPTGTTNNNPTGASPSTAGATPSATRVAKS
jgi:hypothetical protein